MLEFRLKELFPIIDSFIIVESTQTFSGDSKELYFEQNKERYSEYLSKITHIIVDDMPKGNAWAREKHQRNAITRGIPNLNPSDLIIISDADEIPDVNMLENLKKTGIKTGVRPDQDFYYYNLTCKAQVGNSRCRIVNYATFKTKTPEQHSVTYYPAVQKGGWHFSYFGDENFIINKIHHFSHQEFNNSTFTNPEVIKKRIKNCTDLFNRDNGRNLQGPHRFFYQPLTSNKYLPKNYQLLIKFQNLDPTETQK